MDARAYTLMAELEAEHWWYRGRRALIRRLLARLELPERARLLDVGCGTGGNLSLLDERGRGFGVEPSDLGCLLGAATWRGRVACGRATELPFDDETFDVVAALDVLEHVHNDLDALDEFQRVLQPGGHVVIHAPAFPFLWGHEDRISKHLRRYTAAQIRRLLEAAELKPVHVGYATTLLFPVVAAVKMAKRLLVGGSKAVSDVARLPPAWLNEFLTTLLEAEAEIAATAELPFGASVVALARKQY